MELDRTNAQPWLHPLISLMLLVVVAGCATSSPETSRKSQVKLASSGATHANETDTVVPLADHVCPSSTDPTYAFSVDNPVLVGGIITGARRSVAYMSVLRGPDGEGIQYQRLGATRARNGHIVDVWRVASEGLAEPINLFINIYEWEQPLAPMGFTCAEEIPLRDPDE